MQINEDVLIGGSLLRLESASDISPKSGWQDVEESLEFASQLKAARLDVDGNRVHRADVSDPLHLLSQDRVWIIELSKSNDTTTDRKVDDPSLDRSWRQIGLVRFRWIVHASDPPSLEQSAADTTSIDEAMIDLGEISTAWQDLLEVDEDRGGPLPRDESISGEDYLSALDTLFALGIMLENHRGMARAMEVASVKAHEPNSAMPSDNRQTRTSIREQERPDQNSAPQPDDDRSSDPPSESGRNADSKPAAAEIAQ